VEFQRKNTLNCFNPLDSELQESVRASELFFNYGFAGAYDMIEGYKRRIGGWIINIGYMKNVTAIPPASKEARK